MKIKKSQLKNFIKGVIREAISERSYKQMIQEVSPPGKKAERMIGHVKSSLKKSHPEWNDDKITSVAIATAWKSHNKEGIDEAFPPEISKGKKPTDPDTDMDSTEKPEAGKYDERDEILLIKVVKKVAEKLEQMHKGMPGSDQNPQIGIDGENDELDDQESDNDTVKSITPEKDEDEDDDENEVKENHKVQQRSYRTSNDISNNPKNVRNPKIPNA